MSNRPRTHQLEDESRRAFQSVLPTSWVYRPQTPDYGIDAEVELFSEAGVALGLSFLVQLKATDSPSPTKATRVLIAAPSARYYEQLARPLLIVRFASNGARIWVRWFHAVNPNRAATKSGAMKCAFTEADRWDGGTPAWIESTLREHANILSPDPKLPISFKLDVPAEGVHDLTRLQAIAALQAEAVQHRDIVSFSGELAAGASPVNCLRIRNDEISVRIAGAPRIVVSASPAPGVVHTAAQLTADWFTGIGLALHAFGHDRLGARLAAAHATSSRLADVPESAIALAVCLVRGGRTDSALRLVRQCWERPTTSWTAPVLLMPLVLGPRPLDGPELQLLIGFFEQLVGDAARDPKDGFQLGIWLYNFGSLMRTQRQYRRAAQLYRRAASADPRYAEREYFWRELGGVLFLSGRYRASASCYRRAVSLKPDSEAVPCLADALMHSGAYREAADLLREYMRRKKSMSAEWVLKEHVIARLVEHFDIRDQVRQTKAAGQLFNGHPKDDEHVSVLFASAMKLDLLCTVAWFNMAGVHYRAGRHAEARAAWLCAAVFNPGDVESWANAFVLSAGDLSAALLTSQAALGLNGQRFLLQLENLTSDLPEPTRQALGQVLSELAVAHEPKKLRDVIRSLGPGSEYLEFPARG